MEKTLGRGGWLIAGVLALFMLAVFAGIVQGGPLDPSGVPAPTMKTLQEVEPRTPISSLPYTITESGSYYLTKNLTFTGAGAAITIGVSGVTFDLNGFTLIGNNSADSAIAAFATGDHLIVRNGALRAWPFVAIDAPGASIVVVEHVVLSEVGVGIRTGSSSVVRDVSVTTADNGQGMQLGDDSKVDGCVLRGRGTFSFGVEMGDNSTLTSCTITGFSYGITTGANNRVSDCVVAGFTRDGAAVADGSSISDCSITSSERNAIGLRAGSRVTAVGNRMDLSGNDARCVMLEGSNTVVRQNDLYSCLFGVSKGNGTATLNTIYQNTYHGDGEMMSLSGFNDIGPSPAFATDATSPWANIGP